MSTRGRWTAERTASVGQSKGWDGVYVLLDCSLMCNMGSGGCLLTCKSRQLAGWEEIAPPLYLAKPLLDIATSKQHWKCDDNDSNFREWGLQLMGSMSKKPAMTTISLFCKVEQPGADIQRKSCDHHAWIIRRLLAHEVFMIGLAILACKIAQM